MEQVRLKSQTKRDLDSYIYRERALPSKQKWQYD
jgi:hypothetical protein